LRRDLFLISCAGKALGNLAAIYRALGRLAEAVELEKYVVVFLCRALPKHHPDIGEGHMWRDD
jgi:hypothetical protein